jgi:hypothetical protein
VIERELELPVEDVGDGGEGRVGGVGPGLDRPDVPKDGEVRHGDDVHARVATGVAVRAELGQEARYVDARLLVELASRRLVERLGRPLEAARDRPHALVRALSAPHEQDVQ